MAYTLTNYPGVTLPDTGDPESTASGRISGDAGPTLAKSYDDHDHTAGKGLRVPTAGIDINADLDMGGNRLVNVAEVRASGDVPLTVDRSIGFSDGSGGFTSGELIARNASGQTRQVTNRPFSRMLNIFGGKLDPIAGAATAEYVAAGLGGVGALKIQPGGAYVAVYTFSVEVESGDILNGFRVFADSFFTTVELLVDGVVKSTASGFAVAPGDERVGSPVPSHLVATGQRVDVRFTTAAAAASGLVRYVRLDGIRP